MPATPNAGQLATVSFLDGLNANGTIASQSYWDWVSGTTPALYNTAADRAHKWYNNGSGTALAAASAAGTAGGVVTYGFAAGTTAAQQQAFTSALALWGDEANIGFAPAASAASADVVFSVTYGGGTSTTAAAATTAAVGSTAIPDGNAANGQASIRFDNSGGYGTVGSFSAAGGYGVASLVHEVGHLLGLGHAGAYNGNVTPSIMQTGVYDSRQWTAMSYISPDDKTARYYGSYPVTGTNWQVGTTTGTVTTYYEAAPETPMPLDILAAQQLYGAPVRTALSGGQQFGFNCTVTDGARPFFDFTQNTKPVVTLWDAGGNNSLDLSGFAPASTVNLNPGTFSSAAGLTNNIGIAFGTAIDRAVGGPGDDTFVVNEDNDVIEGAGGTNTVVLSGSYAPYTLITSGATKILRNTATGVTDRLTNVQRLVFADKTVSVAATSPDPLFDPGYYLLHNPDVAAAGIDPYQHYMTYGWREGRDPSALFSDTYYLNQNPDVAAAGVNPLLHFESNGWREGRDPSMHFSDAAYLAHNPDVARAGVDPLLHYFTNGALEGRAAYAAAPHPLGPQDPLVNAAFVDAERPDVAAAGVDATAWFHAYGWQGGTAPDALFDVNYYLSHNPDVAAAHVDPLAHFEQFGWREGRNPSAAFSDSAYLAHNPDVAAAGVDPLVHYLQYGQAEGRAIYPA